MDSKNRFEVRFKRFCGSRWIFVGCCWIAIGTILILADHASAQNGFYSIRIGAFKTKSYAVSAVKKLTESGHDAFLMHETVKNKGDYYRVYLERYRSQKAAEEEAQKFKQQGLISGYYIKAFKEEAGSPLGADKTDADQDKKNLTDRASAPNGFYSIRIGAFKTKSYAVSAVKKLTESGHDAFLMHETVKNKGDYFRVYLERYRSQKTAQKEAQKFKQQGLISYYYIKNFKEGTALGIGPAKKDEGQDTVSVSDPANTPNGFYSIRVGAFKTKSYAVSAVKKLTESGHDAFLKHETIKNKGPYYSVYLERYQSQKTAQKEAQKFKQQGLISYYYVSAYEEQNGPPLNPAKKKARQDKARQSEKKELPSNHPKKESSPMISELVENGDTSLAVKNITFDSGTDGTETVLIHLDRYALPAVFFKLHGQPPQFVIELKNVTAFNPPQAVVPAKAEYIQKIRSQFDPDSRHLKVTVGLYPDKIYEVTQIFDRSQLVHIIKVFAPKDHPDIPGRNNSHPLDLESIPPKTSA